MKLKSLFCPNCGAPLENENGLDIFFCKYCGHKILLTNQSKAAYEAKTHVKYMEHKEKIQDKRNAQERYRAEVKQKDDKRTLLVVLSLFSVAFIIIFGMIISGNIGVILQEKELQSIVDEIMIDIENENFTAAYIKANSLYWQNNWTSEGEDKWDAIREETIKQIEEAELKATGSTYNESQKDPTDEKDKHGFFDWFK